MGCWVPRGVLWLDGADIVGRCEEVVQDLEFQRGW